MGIWIRKQDKTILVKITCLNVCDNKVYGYNSINENFKEYILLGMYSSKERAVKVLDMIQRKILDYEYKEGRSMVNSYAQALYYEKPKVFQMPQDSEVDA